NFGLGGERADAEEAVFGLEPDVHALRDVVGDEGRHADAKVDDIAVAEFGGGTLGDLFPSQWHGNPRLVHRQSIALAPPPGWTLRWGEGAREDHPMETSPELLYAGVGRTVIAMDRFSGRPAWRVKLPRLLGGSISMVLPFGREVYVGRGGYVY